MTEERHVYVVMCPNESCSSDVQIQVRNAVDDDGRTFTCPRCAEQFGFHIPAVSES